MRSFIALAAAFAAAPLTVAAPITLTGNGLLGDYAGSFAYNSTTRTVSVTLTNAATTLPGGKLTGFVFNLPGQPGKVSSVTYVPPGGAGSAFSLLGGSSFSNSVNVNPYGAADFGAALGGDWLGGGSPALGLAIGDTATWDFVLSGDDAYLSTLTEAAFLSQLTTGAGKPGEAFLVRFKGFVNGGSDKVPLGDPNGGPTGTAEVPEPASVLAFATITGLGLLGVRYRRRNRVTAS